MDVRTAEIADGIYRFSSYVPEIAAPAGFTFNQYLIDAEQPLLFHTGPRHMYQAVSAAMARILPVASLRWLSFGHVESDECGSMNLWLAAAPEAQVLHGATACMVSLNDLADRPPRILADGETLDLGGRRIRWIDTPHVPHAWESGLIFEETTGTLFTGDLFTHVGDGAALTHESLVAAAAATEAMFRSTSLTPQTAPTIRRLAGLAPRTLAVMHGSCFSGDGARELQALADYYQAAFETAAA
ncbi:MAG TPA: MBL fold metallo-hydrolase [Phenylobacterium sp.]|uniref:MBL fold metallo-hydrolase n=1 Tax=Phenylobacterium sp. TaxID=1871053 RepID=UPI002C1CFEBB|nr:MBL fold metallo-hydrolase [Phenylobacterium sp.]HSV04565.1 MBL fold metallo-hydrolase [Phenylobacterium sp.]